MAIAGSRSEGITPAERQVYIGQARHAQSPAFQATAGFEPESSKALVGKLVENPSQPASLPISGLSPREQRQVGMLAVGPAATRSYVQVLKEILYEAGRVVSFFGHIIGQRSTPEAKKVEQEATATFHSEVPLDKEESVQISTPELTEKDAKLGYSRTRGTFHRTEPWRDARGKEIGTESIDVVETRDFATKMNKKAEEDLRNKLGLKGGQTSDDIPEDATMTPERKKWKIQLKTCERANRTLARDQTHLHVVGLRETAEMIAVNQTLHKPIAELKREIDALKEAITALKEKMKSGSGEEEKRQIGNLSKTLKRLVKQLKKAESREKLKAVIDALKIRIQFAEEFEGAGQKNRLLRKLEKLEKQLKKAEKGLIQNPWIASLDDMVYVEAPNVQVHSVQVHESDRGSPAISETLLQSGSLSDHRNTRLNLKQLATIVEWDKNPHLKTLFHGRKIQDLPLSDVERFLETPGLSEDEKQAVVEYYQARKEFEATYAELRQAKETGQDPHTGEDLSAAQLSALDHMLKDFSDPAAALVERRMILQRMLSIQVNEDLSLAAREGALGDEVHISRLTLLHPKFSKWESATGIPHDEWNIMQDTGQIYAEFDGATVVFEDPDSEPFINEQDNGHVELHLPRPEGVGKDVKSVTLKTHYGNAAVQRSLGQTGVERQTQINAKMFADLDQAILEKEKKEAAVPAGATPEDIEKSRRLQWNEADKVARARKLVLEARTAMKNGESSYDVATKLIEAQRLLGWVVCTGCYSNKDRGGVVGKKALTEIAMHQKESDATFEEAADPLSEEVERATTLRDEAKAMRQISWASLAPDSIQMAVVNYSVSARQPALKVFTAATPSFQTPAAISSQVHQLARSYFGPKIKD